MKKLTLLLVAAGLIVSGFTGCTTHDSNNGPQPSGQGGNRGESPGMKAKTSAGSMDSR